ncbi:MAG: S-layer homology domain-containing protein [Bacillota bacterium]
MKQRYSVVLLLVLLVTVVGTGSASSLLQGLAGHWAAPLVAALEAKGLVSGDELGRFEPDAPLTRAQMSKLLVLGLGFGEDAQLLARHSSRFSDVPRWHWANGYIESLAETGLTNGYPSGEFGPNDPVTRAQLAVMLVRAAGLSDRLHGLRFARTPYQDDAEIPSWARAEVILATEHGLVNGFPDGTFRPSQSVTRAEGSTVLLRFLNLRGTAYHLTGMLTRWDAPSRTGTVRDDLGQEHRFAMADQAQYFRGGVPAGRLAIKPLDRVWIVLDEDGLGRFMEAHYQDLLAESLQVEGGEAVVTLETGELRTLPLEANGLFYVNGRPASVADLSGKGPAYLVIDPATGGVRVIDAIDAPIIGEYLGQRESTGTVVFNLVESQSAEYPLAEEVRIFLNGQPVPITELAAGDRVRAAVNAEGRLTFIQAER